MKCSFALAQINPTVGDIAGNAQRIRRARRSAPSGALLCLPELALTGYPPGDMLLNATFLDAVESAAQALAAEEGPPTLLATPWRRSGCLHNAALLLENGRVSGLVYKQVLPNYGVFDEKRWFAPSGPQAPLPWCGGRLGVLLCEDTWAPEPTAALAEQGANLLVSLNASPFEGPDKHARRLATARARVAEVGLPLAYVNCVGGQDNLVFDGGSFALDAGGAIVLQAPFFEEGTYISTSHPLQEGSDLVYRALVLATRDYARKNGFARALLGLSGGVDSALVAAVAADALGPEAVTALILPSRFTSDRSLNDARSLADFLNVKYKEISIETLLKAMEEILGLNAGLAHENLQARIRGTLLMARANETVSSITKCQR
jgi:predicted amidohydrolase